MRKLFLLFLTTCCLVVAASAQDLIVKTDATTVQAKVLEITPDAVRYKRFSNPEGPTYVLPIAQIHYITYPNGEKEFFSEPATPATPVTPAASVPESTPAVAAPVESTPAAPVVAAPVYVRKTFAVGDYYDYNGIKGVVCEVDDEGVHGKLLSLDEIYLYWSLFKKPDLRVAGATDRSNGAANMEHVAAYIADNNLTWADFPAFNWCREQGEGWYLPSIDELLTMGHNYNGGSRMQNNRQARNLFNDALKEHGGKRLDRLVYYFSSTEVDAKSAYTTHTGIEPPYVIEIPKNSKFLVRAMRRF